MDNGVDSDLVETNDAIAGELDLLFRALAVGVPRGLAAGVISAGREKDMVGSGVRLWVDSVAEGRGVGYWEGRG